MKNISFTLMNSHCTVLWISGNQQLHDNFHDWENHSWLAIDTEFIRHRTFFPRPALIQIYDGNTIYLIDPLSITNWQPLTKLIISPLVLKIMHAPQEDFEVFRLLTGATPTPLFDTQLASGFCNINYPSSYQRLVHQLLGKHIRKDQTCSDWLKRPLSEEQINYAALDVCYLPALHKKLLNLMETSHKDKLLWCEEETKYMIQQYSLEKKHEGAWKYVHLNKRLHPKQQQVLNALYAWREKYIRQKDIPRNKALSNELLLNISRQQPKKLYHFQFISGMKPEIIRQYGQTLIDLITLAKEQKCPEFSTVYRLDFPEKEKFFKDVKDYCNDICKEADISVAIMNQKKLAKMIILNYENTGHFEIPANIPTWKKSVLKPIILKYNETLKSNNLS